MSGWDDLFAVAAGEVVDIPAPTSNFSGMDGSPSSLRVQAPIASSLHKKKKRKKDKQANDKRKNKMSKSLPNQNHQSFLDSRMDPIDKQTATFPHWLSIGPSLCNNRNSTYFCSGYKNDDDDDDDDDDKCTQCSMTKLYHSSESKDDHDFLNAMSVIRDIRCCCSCIYEIMSDDDNDDDDDYNSNHNEQDKGMERNGKKKKTKTKNCLEYVKTAKFKCEQLNNDTNFTFDTLPIGERDILITKFKNVSYNSDQLYLSIKKWAKKEGKNGENNNRDDSMIFSLYGIFDELISLIIECDAAYYRLYYLQLVGYFEVLGGSGSGSGSDDIDMMIHLPHPPSYFGVNNFTWNVSRGKEWKEKIVDKVQNSVFEDKESSRNDTTNNLSPEQWRYILNPLGFTNRINSDASDESIDEKQDEDPLSFLHENRSMEGLLIFWSSKWIESNQAYKQTNKVVSHHSNSSNNKSDEAFYEQHETIAPSIVAKWRDSCRDFLCNLYGYATLSSSTILGIIEGVFKEELKDVHRIVEMGSGTGYLARLLNDNGLEVDAFDIVPTVSGKQDEINEYHGHCPPFCHVQKGDAKYLKSIFKRKKNPHETALLLCYPPPQTTMAEDMLRTFKSFGGKYIIHVGEFNGLTGSIKFQNLLKRDFDVIQRYDCLQWGTDSAEVTIWMKNGCRSRNETNQTQTILLPCSSCHKKEALKQCRLSRSLRYCGVECFEGHISGRSVHLALKNIPLFSSSRQLYLSYDNSNHFKTI